MEDTLSATGLVFLVIADGAQRAWVLPTDPNTL